VADLQRLDDIFWDLDSGGDTIAALPITYNELIRHTVFSSVELHGIHATAEHWANVLEATGETAKSPNIDQLKQPFREAISECF